jgi:hypothetical protein
MTKNDTTTPWSGAVAPLLLVSDRGDVEVVRQLVLAGADVNQSHPSNALHGEGRAAALHAEECASPAFNAGTTPLMCAAKAGHEECVSTLLQLAADPLQEDAEKWTALHYACFSGHAGIVSLLSSAGPAARDVVTVYERATPGDFAHHRRFGEACRALGVTPPAPLSAEEVARAVAKSMDKLARAEASGEPLLHRYMTAPDVWSVLRAFLGRVASGEAGASCVVRAKDLLQGRRVVITFRADHGAHLAACSSSDGFVRASSVAAIQHFVVEWEQQRRCISS